MSIISLACTKDGVSIVHTTGEKQNFSVLSHQRLAIVQGNWIGLVQSLESVLESRIKAQTPSHWVIVKVSTGQYAAAADTYKAEGFVEYVLAKLGKSVNFVTKQSLPRAIGCKRGEKWQKRAKQLFNNQNEIKGFAEGFDAACAGAFGKAV